MTLDRMNRLVSQMQSAGLDAIALNPSPSLIYLTGLHFHKMERPTVLLITPAATALILPALEAAKVPDSLIPLQTFTFGDDPALWSETFARASQLLHLAGKTIGAEPNQLRLLELRYLEAACPGAKFVSAEPVLNSLRIIKDAEEAAAMRKAVKIAETALLATLPFIQAGKTEKEIAGELVIQLLRAGSDSDVPFTPIVSGGANSANPHAVPSERKLQTGDLLVIDWGAAHNGYVADLTRTFAIRSVEPEFQRIAEIVEQANAAGRAACKPDVEAGAIDRAARQVIAAAGYGDRFIHRTGHGIGMEGHEPPYIFSENDLILAPGMTFTVEPGIYLTGRGGVRIEDNILLTENGAEVFSSLPRHLITL